MYALPKEDAAESDEHADGNGRPCLSFFRGRLTYRKPTSHDGVWFCQGKDDGEAWVVCAWRRSVGETDLDAERKKVLQTRGIGYHIYPDIYTFSQAPITG